LRRSLLTRQSVSGLFAALLLAVSSSAFPAVTEALNDGPYVSYVADTGTAAWVCHGQALRIPVPPARAITPPCPSDVPALTLNRSNPQAADEQDSSPYWAAVSDIHGQAGLYVHLLKTHGIVDAAGNWAWGRGVLVIAGDVFSRGPSVTEALWQIYRLEQQARAAGGSVHLVLGNHEVMTLSGDLRYLHPKYRDVVEVLNSSYDKLYDADTELGRWLRQRATIFKLGDSVFLHGGLHPELAGQQIDLPAMNARFRANLGLSREERSKDPEAKALFGRDGPIWYRGYFLAKRVKPADIDALLSRLGAKRIVVGHTSLDQIRSLYGGRVIGVDANLKDGKPGELLLWREGKLVRGLADGRQLPLEAGDDDGSQMIEVF
jgi:hypothetical protein